MNLNTIIFVGFELTEEVVERLKECSEQDRVYLEDPGHLETLEIDGRRYIGKRAKDDMSLDRLEDIARSVVSLIFRVSRGWSKSAADALVIAAEEERAQPADLLTNGDPNSKDEYDYSELVD